jgi:hypothetical protein
MFLYYKRVISKPSTESILTKIIWYLMSFPCQEVDFTFVGSFLFRPIAVIHIVNFPDQGAWPGYLPTIKYLHLTKVPSSNLVWLSMTKKTYNKLIAGFSYNKGPADKDKQV